MRDVAESPDVMTRIYYKIHLSREKQSSYERWTGNIENRKSDARTYRGARRGGKKKKEKKKKLVFRGRMCGQGNKGISFTLYIP